MFIQIKNINYHITIEGDGEPLLLLHGFTGDSGTWFPFIPLWKKSYKVIAVDIIGHGKTDSPEEAEKYAMKESVAHIKAVIDYLRLAPVHILGYSMGGRLALAYCSEYPETVKKLILESASPGLQTELERKQRRIQDEKLGDSILEQGIIHFVNKWEKIPLFKSQERLDPTIKRAIRNQRLANNPIGLANSLKGMGTGAQSSYWSRISRLSIDTLLITGELDRKFYQIAEEMVKKNKNIRHLNVNNAGHAIHVEKPEIFGTIVMEFLRS
ncbi:2-succinyl-6-hydroxy-2,4-cyclohexadiene-1-carboxylate synthase [Niallia sp. Sow4_A1]|uniref:Putative 2-succinyl-6-hydroxy-2,4-cyclohexadiene-1-carboxylate synthase n=1 Tax=Niallia hominis TaxID=3133173 RepID=A0ABV1F585_9BACI|nr:MULTISPECIES: 2-succinyl-6-hydroxy-2,4-cyclohexadiene-1-carboxylate synthase [Bacillaceae]MCM3362880.1 2-succinyl-6-hydroxy-2,4-cyclohexadiene-1-carboxylate synthase [Niallia sp. MER TA 168]REB78189.1 2-succinyl-6-hydroxy-2,4-cyclohexadiene-1-carboxylate synthase [Cutibacterium acnes]CAI9394660.1 2-succinyl-6-hydroxy-2,4-cyclohexadiene-1-carboxylate synthase [Bacillus sp. T2.9-1]